MDVDKLKKDILRYEVTLEKNKTTTKVLSIVIGVLGGFALWFLIFALLMDVAGLDINGWVMFISLVVLIVVLLVFTRKKLAAMYEKKRAPLLKAYNEANKAMKEMRDNYADYLLHETPTLKCYLETVSEGIGENWWGNRELNMGCEESDLVYSIKIESVEEFAQYLTDFTEYGFQIDEDVIEYIWNETFERGNPFVLHRVEKREYNYSGNDEKESTEGSTENVESVRARYLSILGLKDGCTRAELKKAYREKSKEFHPDTIQGKGLNEIFIHFAEDQFKLLTEAYEWLDGNTSW